MSTTNEDYEKRMKEENIKIARGVVISIESIFKRQRNIDDLCLRNCLFVDKLSLFLDIMMGILTTQMDDNWPEDLKLQIENLKNTIDKDLDNLMTYVRAPSFAPEAGFGNHLIKTTTFYDHQEK